MAPHPRARREEQLVVVAACDRRVHRVGVTTLEPPAGRLADGQGGGVHGRADTARFGKLTHRLRQAVTQIHTCRCRTIVPEQDPESKPRFRVEITLHAILRRRRERRGRGYQIADLPIDDRRFPCRLVPSVTRGGELCPFSQHLQPGRCGSDRPADVQVVARPGAGAGQHLPALDGADDRDVDDQRPSDPCEVATRDGEAVSRRQRDQAFDDAVEVADRQRLRQR